MVMKVEPIHKALQATEHAGKQKIMVMSARGEQFTQAKAEEYAKLDSLTLICGRYEGIDQRVIELAVDEEVSIGDYVLCGGEIPAMVLIEGMVRLLPGLLGNAESIQRESFAQDILEGPQYTRPPVFGGLEVPEVLRAGNPAAVAAWRADRAKALTRRLRPDLLPAPGEEES